MHFCVLEKNGGGRALCIECTADQSQGSRWLSCLFVCLFHSFYDFPPVSWSLTPLFFVEFVLCCPG